MKLRILPFAFTSGLFLGIPFALATLWLLYTGTPGTTISRLSSVLPGFEFSVMGSLVGFGWLFLGGMVGGTLVGALYNVFTVEATARAPRPEPKVKPLPETTPVLEEEVEAPAPEKEKPPKAAKPPKPSKPKKNRTPRHTPKRRKTPYPGRVGAWRDHPYGSYGGYSASA